MAALTKVLSNKDIVMKVEAMESGSVQQALGNLNEMLSLQQQRISRLKAAPPRTASLSSTQGTNAAAGSDVLRVKADRRWNQELQHICENPQLQCFEKVRLINTFLKEFQEMAQAAFHELMQLYLSDEAGAADKIQWASDEEVAVGTSLTILMLENTSGWSKECSQQSMFLSQQLMLFPKAPPIAIFPRCLVFAHGRMALVSADLKSISAPMRAASCPELQYALHLSGASLNLCSYRRALDDNTEEMVTGPVDARAIRCFDGRTYLDELGGWFPVFPPAKGVAAGKDHTLFLRPEFFTQRQSPLSPGSFRVFGARDSASNAKQTRHAAAALCQDLIPAVVSELLLNPPETGAALVEHLHAGGINIGLLPLVYAHVSPSCANLRHLIAAEMVARASRHVIREGMSCRLELPDMFDEVAEHCAALCDADRRAESWNEWLLPVLKKRFPGFSSILNPPLGPEELDTKLWLSRVTDLLNIQFAEGVSAAGTSAFHFTIDAIKPSSKAFPLPQFRVGPMVFKEVGGLSPSPTTLASLPPVILLLSSRLAMERNATPQEAINDFVHVNQKYFDSKSFGYGCAIYEAGSLLQKLKRSDESEVFLDKAIDILAQAGANTHVLGEAHYERGVVANNAGGFRDAVKHLTKAIALFDQAPPPPPSSSSSIGADGEETLVAPTAAFYPIASVQPKEQLAALYEQKGLLEEAEPLYREALATLKAVCGEVDRRVSTALNNLACNLFTQEQYTEAEGLYQDDIRISELLYGQDSPELATALNNLAAVYDALDRREEAEPLYRRDLEITMRAMGENHNNVATSRNNLATCLQKLGRLDEADVEYEKALKIRRTHCGERHVTIADFLTNIGALKLARGEPIQAKRTFEEALGIYEESLGKTHHCLRRCLDHLCNLCEALGEDEECEMYSDRLMELKRADNDIYTAQQAAVHSSDKK